MDLERLAARVDELERRLAVLEGSAQARPSVPEEEPAPASTVSSSAAADLAALLGRTVLVLGGGFLLRALTEWQVVPEAVGMALGFAYALWWLLRGDVDAGRGLRRSAAFHAAASAAIVFPLIWEATARFDFVGPAGAIVALAAVSAGFLAVSWRRDLPIGVWIAVLGGTGGAWALAVATRTVPLPLAFLLALSLAVLWTRGRRASWAAAGSGAAAALDLSLVLATMLLFVGAQDLAATVVAPRVLVLLQSAALVGFVATSLGRAAGRTTLPSRDLVQDAAVALTSVGGGIVIARLAGVGVEVLALAALGVSAACYGVSFAFLDRREGHRREFVFYTTLAFPLALLGLHEVLPRAPLAIVLAGCAVAASWGGWRSGRATAGIHAALCAVSALSLSGALRVSALALFFPAAPTAELLDPVLAVTVAAVLVCCAVPAPSWGPTWGRFAAVPRLVLLACAIVSVGGLVVIGLAPLLPSTPSAVAALRTGVLAAGAVALALLGRAGSGSLPQAGWLVYPVLVMGGAKVLVEDLRTGSASGLVVSLLLYGVALLVAPRLTRDPRQAAA